MAAKRSRNRGWEDDPLVSVHCGRLRAAMEEGGWTVTTLGRELTARSRRRTGPENRQTLHYLQKGDGLKRCRRSRRVILAEVLGTPESWLEGNPYPLPVMGYAPLAAEVVTSPRAALAVGRLFERVVMATLRDLEEQSNAGGAPLQQGAVEETIQFIIWSVAHAIGVRRWQARLITWPATTPTPNWHAEPPALTLHNPALESAVLGCCRAMEFILGPWLDGEAMLDFAQLRELTVATQRSATAPTPQYRMDESSFVSTSPLAVLGVAPTPPVPKARRASRNKTTNRKTKR